MPMDLPMVSTSAFLQPFASFVNVLIFVKLARRDVYTNMESVKITTTAFHALLISLS